MSIFNLYRFLNKSRQGYKLFKKKKIHDAIEKLNSAIDLVDGFSDFVKRKFAGDIAINIVYRGSLFYLVREEEKARKDFLKALEIDSNSYNAFNFLGLTYLSENDIENAKSYFEKSLSLKNNSSDVLYNLGKVYNRLKNYPIAVDYLNKVNESDKNSSFAYLQLSISYFHQNQFEKALLYYKKVIDRDSISKSDLMRRFLKYKTEKRFYKEFDIGSLDDVTSKNRFLSNINKLDSLDSILRNINKAAYFMIKEDLNSAITILENNNLLDDKLAINYYLIGCCYDLLGHDTEAYKSWNRAKTLGYEKAKDMINEKRQIDFRQKFIRLIEEHQSLIKFE
ncbi:MAG: hypothetical protein CMO01_02855 [Thalassobius sp.]|nr:hypothetical protein [Thalassovita sp.]